MTTSAPPSPAPARRGLLDGALVVMLIYAVYARTPLGAIAETAVLVARGRADHPSWLASFRGRETDAHILHARTAPLVDHDAMHLASVHEAARVHGVAPQALLAVFSAHGTCTATTCTLEAPPRTSSVLPALAGKRLLTPDDVGRALAAGLAEFEGDVELAIEALWVGAVPVQRAVEKAKRSALADPTNVDTHAAFLSPSLRRGPLQGALAALGVHRLNTLVWPTDAALPITSPFGPRVHPVTGKPSFHNGTDVGTPVGTPLVAVHHGTVRRVGHDSVSGTYLVIDHGLGLQSTFCHLSAAVVQEGARVHQSASVARSGATGRVSGPHLHYVLRVGEAPVDAARYGGSPRPPSSASPAPPGP